MDPLIGWCLTYPFNMSSHPVANVPAGLDDDGLPVRMQVAGPRFADETVLAASAAVERTRPWDDLYPPRVRGDRRGDVRLRRPGRHVTDRRRSPTGGSEGSDRPAHRVFTNRRT